MCSIMYSYIPIIFDLIFAPPVCKAYFLSHQSIAPFGNQYIIQSFGLGVSDSYPNNRLFVYSITCPLGSVPVVDELMVSLQEPIPYENDNYCVDYVKIDPPIDDHPSHYCGTLDYTEGKYVLNDTNEVEVRFRTSENDNNYPGFFMRLHCHDQTQAQENKLSKYLKLHSNSVFDYYSQQVSPLESVHKVRSCWPLGPFIFLFILSIDAKKIRNSCNHCG